MKQGKTPEAASGAVSSALTLRLFGPFDARIDGEPIPRLRNRKAQWLVALLGLRSGREVDREWLAGTLWPDSAQAPAFYNLRRALTDLRSALGSEAGRLASPTTRTLSLQLEGVEFDVSAFDAATSAGDPASLEQAVSLYRGPLLEGCFEEWVHGERAPREQEFLRALETLAAGAIARGDFSDAEARLRRALASDPLRESALRALLEALAGAGNHAAATHAYREFRLYLHDELHVEPSGETRAVYERLREAGRSLARPLARKPVDRPPPRPRLLHFPRPLTALVGREREIREIGAARRSSRLITLTGAGGIGKTRLAVHLAEALVGDGLDGAALIDGAAFVDLGPLSDPARVVEAVAAAVDLQETTPGRSLFQALRDVLEDRSLLLVLDNCEHLIEECARVAADLLHQCPHLSLLATSRQSLGVPGETVYRVSPLSLPDLRHPSDGEEDLVAVLNQSEAARLFVERSKSVDPAFRLTERNAGAALRICRQLDGIPLAIELAAARVKVLSVEQIAARLDDRFRLLNAGSRTVLPRQRTLRALIDWSYDLLAPEEQSLLRRLSVFAGGWTLEAAEAVGAEGSPDSTDALDLLSQLIDKSLVVAEDTGGAAFRYRMLETVRQYARDHLVAAGEAAAVRLRHRDWFVAFAERAELELRGPEQIEWGRRLQEDHDNLLAALQACRDPGGEEAGLRLAGALGWFWSLNGLLSEGREAAEAALSGEVPAPSETRAKALESAGRSAWHQGEYRTARNHLEECKAIRETLEDRDGFARALHNLGWMASHRGELAEARALHEEAFALFEETGSPLGLADSLSALGGMALLEGDPATAKSLITRGADLFRSVGDPFGLADALGRLGEVALKQGEYETARAFYLEGLALRRELGYRSGIATLLDSLGRVAQLRGDSDEARAFYRESLAIRREMWGRGHLMRSLEKLGGIAASNGEPEHAARLFGAAEAMREATGAPWFDPDDYGRSVDLARELLGPEPYAAAFAEGYGMPIDRALLLASGDEPARGRR